MKFEASRAKALNQLNNFVENNLGEYSKLRNFDLDSISSSTGSRNVRSRIRKKRNSGGISLDLS